VSVFKSIKGVLVSIRNFMFFARNQSSRFRRKLVSDQHQLTSTTSLDRYPELFTAVRENTPQEHPAILSFGCSTGEECLTIKSYFPEGTIIGVDINKRNLRKAIKSNTHGKSIHYHYSTPENIVKHGKYDVIFALSVLCRWEDTKDMENCENVYSFEKFSETVNLLVSQLRPGGLFIVYNSNFRFEDDPAFKNFSIVPTPLVENSGFVHKFDSHNNRIREVHKHCVYRKVS
jgi:chemotaxis methyl-accepting protein methylase